MTLSNDEKRELQAEAEDPRRREIFKRIRKNRMRKNPGDLLGFLEHAANLFDPDGVHSWKRKKISGSRFLL